MQPDATTRNDAMRHVVLAEEIARALDASDRTMLALSFVRAAMALDPDVAAWAIQRKPWLQ
jgi:hypothetical protein